MPGSDLQHAPPNRRRSPGPGMGRQRPIHCADLNIALAGIVGLLSRDDPEVERQELLDRPSNAQQNRGTVESCNDGRSLRAETSRMAADQLYDVRRTTANLCGSMTPEDTGRLGNSAVGAVDRAPGVFRGLPLARWSGRRADRDWRHLFDGYAAAHGLRVLRGQATGLVPDFEILRSGAFDPGAISPAVIDFYTQTSEYDLDAWSQWCGAFRPFGWMLAVLFSRRLQQLNVPLSNLDTSRGMTSKFYR